MLPDTRQKGGKRTVSTAIGGQVGATIQEAPHPFYRYIVATPWNILARNWTRQFERHDAFVGGAFDPLPSPIGVGFVARRQPLLRKGAAQKGTEGLPTSVPRTKMLASSALGEGLRCSLKAGG